jgi:DNA-binding Lrp family transcriptional regulator
MPKSENVEAFVLIVVERGAEEEVLRGLVEIEGVSESSLVYGEFDIHCKIEVKTMANLREVITRIRELRVATTETLIAYERRFSRLTKRHHEKMYRNRARR